MIVDCYTWIWDSPAQLGRDVARIGRHADEIRRAGDPPPYARAEQHIAAAEPVDASIVLGFKSRYLEAEIPNRLVADYVRRYPTRLIGFAGIDPNDPRQAVDEMNLARADLGMRGIAMSPSAQNFHPCHTNAKACYEAAVALDMPVLFHGGVMNRPESVLHYAQPVWIDEVAREFPKLKIIVAHMGFPWVHETIALLAKHLNIYSDVSWLLQRPWSAYQSLLDAYQHDVMHKLLFGSGFPYTKAAHCIEALYGINHVVDGTNMPTIPRDQLRGIVERDTLGLLGISNGVAPTNGSTKRALLKDEEDDD